MEDLSLSQEFFLLSLNEKGKISSINTDLNVCVVASALFELSLRNIVKIEDKKTEVIEELPQDMEYLLSFYKYLKEKVRKINNIISDYTQSFSGKKIYNLYYDLGQSLYKNNIVDFKEKGKLDSMDIFIPKKSIVENIINEIKKELLGSEKLDVKTVVLTNLLDKSHQLKQYFSSYEKKDLKNRLKEIKNSEENKMIQDMLSYIDFLTTVIFVPYMS
ncbi:GPP34 family phosphoprotein [Miniphocaeibacter massiliensis]|uniref:GPP34 family phosphoprotein n=1 Tax=Miniphocaeibacter massiliensis TaxID=2041841 RepID=UPI000C073F20|nr:GPP34 family phosphoprotein [Miniphocaeibacter massiliensis]